MKKSLASGGLQHVLADDVEASAVFSLVWLTSRHLSPKIRAFVDFRESPQSLAIAPGHLITWE